jgi:hypothetical protein
MVRKLTVITPPDIVANRAQAILLIAPQEDIKRSLDNWLTTIDANMHVYVYSQHDRDIPWLLSLVHRVQAVIVDYSNMSEDLKEFFSFIIGQSNVFYRIDNPRVDYSIINPNRFYDFPDLKGIYKSL